MFRKHLSLLALMVLVLVAAAGCVPVTTSPAVPGETSGPVAQAEPAATTADLTGLRPIPVSSVSVEVGVGSPIPVDAFVSGEWPDLCAQLALINQQFQDSTFDVTLLATAGDPDCPPDTLGLPFRIAIPINVVQLPEGTYTVTVNGATTTFTVPVTSPAALPPDLEPTVDPSATPAPAATVAAAEETTVPEPAAGIARYQGPNPYRATASFEVAYDSAVWQYVEDDGSGRQSQLKHTSLPGCAIWLRAGPVDATPVATVWLAESAWTIAQAQENVIQYSLPHDGINWVFAVLLPEAYSGQGNSTCQDAAERVLDTFKALTQ